MIYSIPHLQQFMSTAGIFRPSNVRFTFLDRLYVKALGVTSCYFKMVLGGRPRDWQVVSAAQVSHALTPVFAEVENLYLEFDATEYTSKFSNHEADRTWWREFLGSFGNVKTLHIDLDDVLFGPCSRALQPDEGESVMELLPELQKLTYDSSYTLPGAFTVFADARQKAGHPVTIIDR
jgi:hypothetical protein